MTREDYDNIAACVRKRGTKTQRKALAGMLSSAGWDQTHGNELQIARLKKQIAELREENFLLKITSKKQCDHDYSGGNYSICSKCNEMVR